jgi:hypothetical protein
VRVKVIHRGTASALAHSTASHNSASIGITAKTRSHAGQANMLRAKGRGWLCFEVMVADLAYANWLCQLVL